MYVQLLHLLGEFIITVTPIVLTVLFVVLGNFIIKSGKSKEIMSNLELVENIAKSVVATVEKQGVLDNLTGSEKFNKAVKDVQEVLDNLGITSVDIETIKQKVEYAYAQEKEIIKKAYE